MGWVLFDYGNVICYPQPDEDLAEFARQAECPLARFSDAYWEYRLDYDRAVLDAPTYWQKVGASLGREFTSSQVAALVQADIRSWLHLRPGTLRLIEDLAAAGSRLALLSNAPSDVAEHVMALPVAAHFEHLAFSCYLRAAKPDRAAYDMVLADLGADPGDVVFLDDRPANVAGAQAAGLIAIHFRDPDQARADLARYIPAPRTPAE